MRPARRASINPHRSRARLFATIGGLAAAYLILCLTVRFFIKKDPPKSNSKRPVTIIRQIQLTPSEKPSQAAAILPNQ